MDFLDDVREQLTGAVSDYVQGGNVNLFLKTNFGPEVPLYTGSDGSESGGGLADLVGLKAQIIIKDKNGKTITTYGEPAPTEPLKAAALGLAAGMLLWFVWRAI